MKAEELKNYRIVYGLSQLELAEAVGTNRVRISEWENGKHEISKSYERLLTAFFKEKKETQKKSI